MKIIETEAVEPQPVRKEALLEEVEEIFIFDVHNTLIGSEWRIKEEFISE